MPNYLDWVSPGDLEERRQEQQAINGGARKNRRHFNGLAVKQEEEKGSRRTLHGCFYTK
jgi:hypothetical protein